MKMKRLQFSYFLALFLIFLGCGGEESKKEKQTTEQKKGTSVNVREIKEQKFRSIFKTSGTYKSRQAVNLTAESGGKLLSVLVKVGQTVNKGKLLANLNAAPLKAALKELETNEVLTKKIYEKQSALWNDGIGSEIDFLKAKTNYKTIQNKKENIISQIMLTKLTAPFHGVIDELFINVGNVVSPGVPVLRIIGKQDSFVSVQLPEKLLGTIAIRDKGKVLPLNSTDTIIGKITAISKFINTENRSFTVEIQLLKNRNLFINQSVMVLFETYKTDKALVLNTQFMSYDQKGKYVFVIKNENEKKIAQKQYVTLGKIDNQIAEVLTGIEAGDIVVEDGYNSLSDGYEVIINKK